MVGDPGKHQEARDVLLFVSFVGVGGCLGLNF